MESAVRRFPQDPEIRLCYATALLAVKLPVIEIHMTNIHARESFRHNSYMSKAAKAMVCGFGSDSYSLAIIGLAGIIGADEQR